MLQIYFAFCFFYIIEGFNVNGLSKLDMIIENQEEMINLLKHLASVSSVGSSGELFEDVFPQRVASQAEFQQLNEKLDDLNFRKKMVKYNL